MKDFNNYIPPYFTGIFGHNINYSLSPLIHKKMVELCLKEGISERALLCYSLFDVSPVDFPAAINGLKALGMKGANVTQPYKTQVKLYLDDLDGEADLIGAVNTVNREKDGSYKGYNTDINGFVKSLRSFIAPGVAGKKVIALGAGGASRAVIYGLIKEKVSEVLIVNRNIAKAESLCSEADTWKEKTGNVSAELSCSDFNIPEDLREKFFMDCFLIINCVTPSRESLDITRSLPLGDLGKNYFAMDISYNNKKDESFLGLFEDKAAGLMNGLPMLLFQAIESFYIWTGKKVDFESLRNSSGYFRLGY